jgi:hypothetical protein
MPMLEVALAAELLIGVPELPPPPPHDANNAPNNTTNQSFK